MMHNVRTLATSTLKAGLRTEPLASEAYFASVTAEWDPRTVPTTYVDSESFDDLSAMDEQAQLPPLADPSLHASVERALGTMRARTWWQQRVTVDDSPQGGFMIPPQYTAEVLELAKHALDKFDFSDVTLMAQETDAESQPQPAVPS